MSQRRFYDPCHTCASLLLVQGVHPRVVIEIRKFPADQAWPIVEVGEVTPETGKADLMRVEPEILPERQNGRERPQE